MFESTAMALEPVPVSTAATITSRACDRSLHVTGIVDLENAISWQTPVGNNPARRAW
jgi:hypothetical protein